MPFSVFFRNPLIQLALRKIRKKHESQPYLLITLFKPTRVLYHCDDHENCHCYRNSFLIHQNWIVPRVFVSQGMEERLVQTTQHNHTKMSNVCFAQVYLEWDLLPQSSAVVWTHE